jgi:hypothetical protein
MADLLVPETPLGDVQTLGVLVVDESGSMGRYGDAPPRALEGYLADLREGPDAAATAATIVTFSSEPRVRIPLCPVRATPRFVPWQPEGGTRLYGAVYDVLASLLLRRSAFANAVVAVFTDGEDNRSSEKRRLALVELAKEAQRAGWTLLTFGIGIDAAAVARAMGFPDDAAHAKTIPAQAEAIAESIRCSSHITRVTAASIRPPR